MPSSFSGMDPYIEGQIWPDFHHNFIAEIQAALIPQLRPRYMARIEERVYMETESEDSVSLIRSDVTITRDWRVAEPRVEYGVPAMPVVVPILMPEEMREAFLEVRSMESHELVTVIEVLSPANKRAHSVGRKKYLAKRRTIFQSRTHLVEIDLLRGGERLPMARPLPPADYYTLVSRAYRRPATDVWPTTLRQPLPTVPVPLARKEPDVFLNLQTVFNTVYDRAGYDYSIDYKRGAHPPLSEDETAWAQELLKGTISNLKEVTLEKIPGN